MGRRIHAAAAKSSDSLSLETKCGESASWHRGIQTKFPFILDSWTEGVLVSSLVGSLVVVLPGILICPRRLAAEGGGARQLPRPMVYGYQGDCRFKTVGQSAR